MENHSFKGTNTNYLILIVSSGRKEIVYACKSHNAHFLQFQNFSDDRVEVLKSYLLELITIDTWEKAGSPPSFNMKKAFAKILDVLANYDDIDIHWDKNYSYNQYWLTYWSLANRKKR